MAIDFRKYVNIISGVGGAANVAVRQLVLRIFSTSLFIDPNSVLEFTNAEDVGTFFGTTSDEYARAVFYFGWISPLITAAPMMSFARYPNAAAGAAIFGGKDAKSLLTFQMATTGKIQFVVDGVQVEIVIPTLAAAGSFAAIATILQTAISANASFATATVTYNAPTNQFILQLPTADAANSVTVIADASTVGTPNDLGTALEWTLGNGGVPVGKVTVQTGAAMFNNNVLISNNFGSFIVPELVDLPSILALAQTNATWNTMFQYHVSVTAANAPTWSPALLAIPGVGLTLPSPLTTIDEEYPEMCEPIIMAATDYTRRNAVMAPMYKVFALTPSVTDTTTSNAMDALRVNYYGVTQNAGNNIAFYQRGKLMGSATGIAQVIGTIQDGGVTDALNNGVIAVGKALTPLQKLYITNETGDDLAWQQVQSIGYWLTASASSSVVSDGSTEYAIDYILTYSKKDSVRTINGTHVLI